MTEQVGVLNDPQDQTRRGDRPVTLLLVGGVCGLAWAAGFRGFMAEVAGPESTVEWIGTFEGILLPGVVTGVLLGWAEQLRRTGGRRGWRWLALAPLAFVAATPLVLVSIFIDGLGGGAVAVPLFGMAGGYALSGRGPTWARIVTGAVALTSIPAWVILAPLINPGLGVDTPRGAWVAVLYISFLLVLALGCAIPHRPVTPQQPLKSRST